MCCCISFCVFNAKTAYEMRISGWSSDVCSSDLSNGKGVTRDGQALDYPTGPIVWGGVGTDGQHAFFQLLHQGGRLVPADFIAAIEPHHGLAEHPRMLLANCLAQGEAFMRGRTLAEAKADLAAAGQPGAEQARSEEHTSELQSLMRISY